MAVGTNHREVLTATTEGQYSPVWLKLARLVRTMLVTVSMETVHMVFEISTKKEPIRMLGFTLRLLYHNKKICRSQNRAFKNMTRVDWKGIGFISADM